MRFDDDDDDGPSSGRLRFPLVVYLIIGGLAAYGLYSLMDTLITGVQFAVKAALGLVILLVILYGLKAMFFARRDKRVEGRSKSSKL